MVFVDWRLIERKGVNVYKKKVLSRPGHLLGTVMKEIHQHIPEKYSPIILDICVDRAVKCIKSISCNDSGIVEYVGEPIKDLDSTDSPTFISGLGIVLSPVKPAINATTTEKARTSFVEVLMKKVILNMKYLEYKTDIDEVTRINKQIIHKLYGDFEGIELGYADSMQHATRCTGR